MVLKEAMLYEQMAGGRVQCNLCGRRCTIPEGSTGFCRVRKNDEGRLYSLVYGKACAANADPITKKPLAFFHPGSSVMSYATVGCNFRCLYCDNWTISQEKTITGSNIPPERLVRLAREYDCQGLSATYTEPTIFFEYAYDTAKLAYEQGLFHTFVTNGYMTPEAVETISPYLDAATVDFKGGAAPEFYKRCASVPSVEPIFDSLKEMTRHDIHIEVTNLVVTKHGDSIDDIRGLATWIRDNLGKDTPFHLLRFHPDYRLTDIGSTPLKTLEQAYEAAMDAGLDYVLLGNVPGHRYENTRCPSCGEVVIGRYGFEVIKWLLGPDNTCMNCGHKIAVRGSYHREGLGFPFRVI
ncbi:MAG: AmmeMemoRadiSam system radical SAM enzyme [Candidatus Bathyarchaeia archaeon]